MGKYEIRDEEISGRGSVKYKLRRPPPGQPAHIEVASDRKGGLRKLSSPYIPPTYINQSEYTEAASGIAPISVLYLVQNANWRSFHESQSF